MRVLFSRGSWLVPRFVADNWVKRLVAALLVHPVEQWRVWRLLVLMLYGLLRLYYLLNGRLEPVWHLGKERVKGCLLLATSWCLSTTHHHLVQYVRWRVHHLGGELRDLDLFEFRLKILNREPHRLLSLGLLEHVWSHLLVLRFDLLQAFAERWNLLSQFFNFLINGLVCIFFYLLFLIGGRDNLLELGRLY